MTYPKLPGLTWDGTIYENEEMGTLEALLPTGGYPTAHAPAMTELPDGSLVMGMPARVNRTLSDEEIARLCTAAGDEYLAVGARMLEEGLLHNPEPDADAHLGF